jgi:D-arabinose 1-dehydrogenase-like Zn-dependent alcohol dehydrogenase
VPCHAESSHDNKLEGHWQGKMGEMRALRLHEDGLRVEEIELPEPGPGEALVRVHAAAITRDELTWPTDRLPATPSYELSGVVVDGGDEVVALTRSIATASPPSMQSCPLPCWRRSRPSSPT